MKRNIFLTLLSILMLQCSVFAESIKFVQVTDTHFIAKDKYRTEVLEETVKSINKEKDISFVVFTGDNLDSPKEEYLPDFINIINKLDVPYYLVIGNHDVFKNNGLSKDHYLEIVKDYNYFYKYKKANYVFKKDGFVFIVVDGAKEIIPGSIGYYKEDTLKWLDKQLKKYKNKPVIILQHFPLLTMKERPTHRVYQKEKYLELLDKYEAMPEKVMTRKFVAKRIGDPLYLATLLEAVGEADGTLAGIDTTTYEFVLAANSIIGMEPGCPTASGLLILEVPGFDGEQGNCIGMSDGAVCIEPTVEQHASIAIASCETFEAVTGKEARCAFLSYSTDGSGGSSEPVKKVRAALQLAQEKRPDLKIDGEFQADAAIDKRVGEKKVKRPSEVAGRANVLIFPDAAACNIGSKLAQRLSNSQPYGPLYQGFRLPILDCSRSDTDVTLYNDIALLSVLAAYKKEKAK